MTSPWIENWTQPLPEAERKRAKARQKLVQTNGSGGRRREGK